ncbi:MAG: hypothetical protein ACYS32_04430 [Planctomycetota bacterium]|jgi:hypothetical protein
MDTTQPQQEPSPNRRSYAADEQSQTKAVSKEFAKAAKENVVGQIVGIIFFSLILDGGFLLNLWLISCSAYWVGFVFIRLRRPAVPSQFDLVFLHLGVVFLFAISIVMVSIMSYIFVGGA